MVILQCLALLWLAGGFFNVNAKEFRRILPVSSEGRVELHSERGTMHIYAWDRQEVQLYARVEADASSLHPEEDLRHAQVTLEPIPDGVRMLTDLGSRWRKGKFGHLPHVYYEIHVPRHVNLSLEDRRSSIEGGDLIGKLSLKTDRSSVRLSAVTGSLSVRANRGAISVQKFTSRESSQFETDRTSLDLGLTNRRDLHLDLNLNRVSPFVDEAGGSETVVQVRRHHVTMRAPAITAAPTLSFVADRGSIHLRAA
jgi:hypothetical protein